MTSLAARNSQRLASALSDEREAHRKTKTELTLLIRKLGDALGDKWAEGLDTLREERALETGRALRGNPPAPAPRRPRPGFLADREAFDDELSGEGEDHDRRS